MSKLPWLGLRWRVQQRLLLVLRLWWLPGRAQPMCLERPLPRPPWLGLRWWVQQCLVLRLWWLPGQVLPMRLERSLP